MYAEHLGPDYHQKLRKLLTVDEKVLPDSMIDAEANIGAMRLIINDALGPVPAVNLATLRRLQEAGFYVLAAVLCVALKSRTAVVPFQDYKRNWDKQRAEYMVKAQRLLGAI